MYLMVCITCIWHVLVTNFNTSADFNLPETETVTTELYWYANPKHGNYVKFIKDGFRHHVGIRGLMIHQRRSKTEKPLPFSLNTGIRKL